jgi:hypothetical protein
MQNRTPIRRYLTLVAILSLGLSACGGGDPADVADAAPTALATDEETVVEVTLVDYEFLGVPDTVEAGTRLTVVNEADAELHELVAFRLPDDEDRSVQELTTLAPEELVGSLGEPMAVLLAVPGGPQIAAVGDGTLTDPGRYALMCFIPTGVEPQVYLDAAAETVEGPPQVDGAGPPHFVQGMFAELEVS